MVPAPQGQQIVDSGGHYSLVIIRSDLPKFASSNREAGTPEENKAIAQGSIAKASTGIGTAHLVWKPAK